MSTLPGPPGGASGRRGNGLASAEWGALLDLDPRLSEALLERLAIARVAAYVEPSAGGPSTAALHGWAPQPPRPLDRLFVDPARADLAREVVSAELTDLLTDVDVAAELVRPVPRAAAPRVLAPPALPAPPADGEQGGGEDSLGPSAETSTRPSSGSAPPDEDEVWRQIVAGFERDVDAPVPPWPASEDVDPDRRPTAPEDAGAPPPAPPSGRRLRRRGDQPATGTPGDSGLPGWLEPDAIEPDETDPANHYVPPPAPPAPRVKPRTLAAVAAVVLGLLLAVAPDVLGVLRSVGTGLLGVVLILGGSAALVWGVQEDREDGPDDGAVV